PGAILGRGCGEQAVHVRGALGGVGLHELDHELLVVTDRCAKVGEDCLVQDGLTIDVHRRPLAAATVAFPAPAALDFDLPPSAPPVAAPRCPAPPLGDGARARASASTAGSIGLLM